MKNITAIILAAGKGVRMRSAMSKVLHELNGKPLIYYILREVKKTGIKRIIVVVGYQNELVREKITDFFKGIEFIQQKKPLGTADALRKAEDRIKKEDNVLILPADVPLIRALTLKKLINKHCRDSNHCSFFTAYSSNPYGYGRIVRSKEKIIEIKEERDISSKEKKINEINSGIYLFRSKSLFNALSKITSNNKKKEYYLTDAISLFAKQNLKINSVLISENEILGINTRNELANAEKIIRKRILKKIMQKGVSIIDPETTYISEDVIIGADTIIYPCTFIEGKIKIGKECKIGPFVHIRGDCSIGNNVLIGNFVEVVRSKIKDRCYIKHHSYLGDCLVEEGVNIGAGAITANYDGKEKNKTLIGQNAFIGSGTVLVAPVKIGKGAITGAGSVVLKNRDVANGETVAGVPAHLI